MHPPKIAFLGPLGTHSHEACIKRFGTRFIPHPCRNFRAIFDSLPDVDAALIPVENSLEGPVTQTLDLLAHHTAVTVREAFNIPIHNHLALNPKLTQLDAVRVVYSHPQVLGQCEEWFHHNLPRADLVPTSSTSEAARRAADENDAAAASSEVAAKIYKLRIVARNIQDTAANATRFMLITDPQHTGVRLTPPKSAERPKPCTLLHLILHNRPGALLTALKPFDRTGLNLSFIQSRPLPGRPWEYGFFIEVDAPARSPALRRTMKLLARCTQVCRVIGSYACFGLGKGRTRQV